MSRCAQPGAALEGGGLTSGIAIRSKPSRIGEENT